MSEIAIKRADIRRYFDETAKIAGTDGFTLSEDGLYYFEAQQYIQTDPKRNWVVTKIQIGHTAKKEFFFEYLTDHDINCYLWILKDKKNYLLFPEFQGGQSIFDVEENKLHSFYSPHEPFIWTSIALSPDKTKLAVTGCVWACPFELMVYDCTNLKALPYTCIYTKPYFNHLQFQQ